MREVMRLPARAAVAASVALLGGWLAGCAGPQRATPAPVEERRIGSLPGPEGPAEVAAAPVVREGAVSEGAEQPRAGPEAGARPSQAETPALEPSPSPTRPSPGGTPPASKAAVVALLNEAGDRAALGNLEAAAASLERALRIAPEDAHLWHELARIRLRQRELAQAAALAGKSNALAGKDAALKARNWRLIAVVRQQRGDLEGAQEAVQRARDLEREAAR
jgi:hypothetical protein